LAHASLAWHLLFLSFLAHASLAWHLLCSLSFLFGGIWRERFTT
jgi:hypothetical protein